MNDRVVLASQSPRRRELLKFLFDEFTVHVSEADESLPEGVAPGAAVEELARRKALAVAALEPGALVVGADTVVAIDGLILGKPRDPGEAAAMLRRLSGREHTVYTGVCLVRGAQRQVFHCRTQVLFKPLSEEEIAWYLSTGEPYDKAGAYGIQGYGARFVRGVVGDYFNVMGLPVNLIYENLAQLPKNCGQKI